VVRHLLLFELAASIYQQFGFAGEPQSNWRIKKGQFKIGKLGGVERCPGDLAAALAA
jgi:hypothetical protein